MIVKIKLTNLFDLALYGREFSKNKPRYVEVETLVDTGATRLYLKPSVIKKLGLQRVDAVRSRTTNGEAVRFKYEPVQLELMGRRENFDVIEDREQAIQYAIQMAVPGDVILLAGKGHETYQEVHGVRRPFSDLDIASRALLAKEVRNGD